MQWIFLMAELASRTPVAQRAHYDWTSVVIALLIALGLVGGFFVLQVANDWLHRTLSRPRQRNQGGVPTNGNLDSGGRS